MKSPGRAFNSEAIAARRTKKTFKEAPLLSLAIDKANEVLGWTPRWDFARTIAETIAWYREENGGSSAMREFTPKQISDYSK